MTIQEYMVMKPNEYQHDGWDADTMAFIGAIAGDIIGSAHELKGTRIKTTDFELFPAGVTFTDDTVMTIAITKWLNGFNSIPDSTDGLVSVMQHVGVEYMQVGYGHSFKEWLKLENPLPYNSLGNGSAMRVTAAGLFGLSLSDCQKIARLTAEVSHNHPEGIKGAEAVASAIRLAKRHRSKDTIKDYIEAKFGYDLSRSLDDIRETYGFDPTCQGSVPEAIICFLESTGMESAIRLAVSLGGDADTQACIAGGIAGAYYGDAPDLFADKLKEILPEDFFDTIGTFIRKNNDTAKTFCERPVLDEQELISTILKR